MKEQCTPSIPRTNFTIIQSLARSFYERLSIASFERSTAIMLIRYSLSQKYMDYVANDCRANYRLLKGVNVVCYSFQHSEEWKELSHLLSRDVECQECRWNHTTQLNNIHVESTEKPVYFWQRLYAGYCIRPSLSHNVMVHIFSILHSDFAEVAGWWWVTETSCTHLTAR